MASHKTLKSVVRSMAESFTSLMNYSGDDYVMGHIVYSAWKTGGREIFVDLLSGKTNQSPLFVSIVQESVSRYIEWFPELVQSSNSDMAFIASAELRLTVDPTKRRAHAGSSFQESPFVCRVIIIDDHDKSYTHEIEGWWYPEKLPPKDKKRWYWPFCENI